MINIVRSTNMRDTTSSFLLALILLACCAFAQSQTVLDLSEREIDALIAPVKKAVSSYSTSLSSMEDQTASFIATIPANDARTTGYKAAVTAMQAERQSLLNGGSVDLHKVTDLPLTIRTKLESMQRTFAEALRKAKDDVATSSGYKKLAPEQRAKVDAAIAASTGASSQALPPEWHQDTLKLRRADGDMQVTFAWKDGTPEVALEEADRIAKQQGHRLFVPRDFKDLKQLIERIERHRSAQANLRYHFGLRFDQNSKALMTSAGDTLKDSAEIIEKLCPSLAATMKAGTTDPRRTVMTVTKSEIVLTSSNNAVFAAGYFSEPDPEAIPK